MPRHTTAKTLRTPAYHARAGYDQVIVTLTDSATKRRRDYWLGEHGTPVSRELFHRVIAAWEVAGRRLPDPAELHHLCHVVQHTWRQTRAASTRARAGFPIGVYSATRTPVVAVRSR